MSGTPAHAPWCAPADPAPRAPHFVVPPGACDAHLHVFGPESRYPYQHERAYTPPDALPPAMAHLHATLGIERSVLVQASVYGTDNRSILDAVALDPERRRAVVSVSGRETDAELSRLNDLGVRGIRVNLVDRGGMPFASLADLERMAERIAPMGWHVEFLVHVEEHLAFPDLVRRLATPAVVGHFGYTKAAKGVGDAGYQRFLRLLGEGTCWVKLSGPYRISAEEGPPYSDLDPFAAALAEAAPGRLLWGSDWPHVMQAKPMPNDGDLLDLLARWFPDARLRQRVLVDNPAELYGFA